MHINLKERKKKKEKKYPENHFSERVQHYEILWKINKHTVTNY